MDDILSNEPVLSVRNLSVAFRSKAEWNEVVHGISFEVRPRETLALVGESGSGKSVTALSIARLLPSKSSRAQGQILLAGRDVLELTEAEMRRVRGRDVSMIFQEPMTSLNPVMTVGRQIVEVLRLHRGMDKRQAEAEVIRLFERVRIPGAKRRLEDFPHNLSGGMRQRVMIAMALAGNPRLLIADEPTTALDVTVQAEILNLIKTLQDEDGMAVLFITHDMGVVAEISDRTVVMLQGNTVEDGPTAEIMAKPKEPYTKLLLSAVPKLKINRPVEEECTPPSNGMLRAPEEGGETVEDALQRDEQPVLSVRNLTTRFEVRGGYFEQPKKVFAVENVSFALHAGETLWIVGESGSGKSTTGRSILRLVNPEGGSVMLEGEDFLNADQRQLQVLRRRIQMIFQDPYASLDPRMNIGTAIAQPLIAHRLATPSQAKQAVSQLLERVGLSASMAARFPHEFSGGQRQRICIARALILQPKVIVADECVSALDASIKAQVLDLMLDLQKNLNIAYLFISHDMAVVEQICHRVAVMYLGEIVEIGPKEEIFQRPQHPYTRKLLSAVLSGDPANRHRRAKISTEETKSVIFPSNHTPQKRQYRRAGPQHVVQIST